MPVPLFYLSIAVSLLVSARAESVIKAPSWTDLYAEVVEDTLLANTTPTLLPFNLWEDSAALNETLLSSCYAYPNDCVVNHFVTSYENQEVTLTIVVSGNNTNASDLMHLNDTDLVRYLSLSNPVYNLLLLELYFSGHPNACFVAYERDNRSEDGPYGCYIHQSDLDPLRVSVDRQNLLAERYLKTTPYWGDSLGPGAFWLGSFVSSAAGGKLTLTLSMSIGWATIVALEAVCF